MLVSTRGRYALRVTEDLAEHKSDGYIPLKVISERQDISLKYLESIMTDLKTAGLITGIHGKGGGYKLVKEPKEYSVKEILSATETSIAPVACLSDKVNTCKRKDCCKTLPIWETINRMIDDYFSSVTLEDIVTGNVKPEE